MSTSRSPRKSKSASPRKSPRKSPKKSQACSPCKPVCKPACSPKPACKPKCPKMCPAYRECLPAPSKCEADKGIYSYRVMTHAFTGGADNVWANANAKVCPKPVCKPKCASPCKPKCASPCKPKCKTSCARGACSMAA